MKLRNATQEARSVIDTAMVLSYAQIGMMSELEEFVSSPNLANIEEVGERCADQGMFEAARMLFSSISKHDKLASCLVRLGTCPCPGYWQCAVWRVVSRLHDLDSSFDLSCTETSHVRTNFEKLHASKK